MVQEITGSDFDREVLQSDIPVFACFTTAVCGTCFALCLVIEDLSREYESRMKFGKIDVEKEPELAARYDILPLPAVVLFRNGEPVKKLGGFHSRAYLSDSLNALIAGSEQSR